MAGPDKLICTACGGTFFTMQRAEQYVAGGYGTAEFRSISNAPKSFLMCIGCGSPVIPKPAHYAKGSIADMLEQDFRKSVELGQKYRQENSMQNVAKTTASVQELESLSSKFSQTVVAVEEIKKSIEDLKPKPKHAKKAEVVAAG